MIIVRLAGGLGNQMFQYAFAKSLSVRHHTDLKADTDFLLKRTNPRQSFVFRDYDLDIFNLELKTAAWDELKKYKRSSSDTTNKLLNKLLGYKSGYILEPHYHFSKQSYTAPDNSYLEGYWQSEKYFSSISETLKNHDFTFKNPLGDNCIQLMNEIVNTNSVCLNVRRGDFVSNSNHGTCSVEYYKQSENIIASQIQSPHFFVFSDEIDWCRENLHFNQPVTYVGHEYAGKKFRDYLQLMSSCKHFIIPNSSFAWWAVWLSAYKNKIVIAPKKWFGDSTRITSDLVKPEWILL